VLRIQHSYAEQYANSKSRGPHKVFTNTLLLELSSRFDLGEGGYKALLQKVVKHNKLVYLG